MAGRGLREVVEDAITIRMTFSSFEDFWAPMEGKDGPFAEYVTALSGEERTRLRDAVRIAYVDGEPNELRSYAATAWAVRGTVPG